MDSVRVAVRVRPLVQHEIESGCRPCVDVLPDAQQIITKLKRDKFTFNHVFDSNTPQVDVYDSAIRGLVQQLFKGYNVTVLAYGQTGSGKTYSMGTCPSSNQTDVGIIPRAISDIFDIINNDEEWIFKVTVSFVELYNEQLIDLLSNKSAVVELRESNRGICIPGLTQLSAQSADDILRCLHNGSLCRTTGATAMNAQSSRSHAIFTIYIHQVRRKNEDDAMSAKFHLVDLAGSERSKKTKAEGKRFMEGVNINKELFVLGNVISALCDNAPFVNYRDSKLTRLLQDSLGGNSLTLMLACVSPADSNLDETVNTLRYADRARKIKNKPVVNQDPNKEEINRLRREVEDLQLALLAKQGDKSCPPDHQDLLDKNGVLIEKNKKLTISLDSALNQITSLLERALMAEAARDKMNAKLLELNTEFNNTLEKMESSILNESQKNNMLALKTKLEELKADNERSENERIKYEEEQLCVSTQSSPCPKSETEPPTSGEVDDEATEEYLFNQAKLNKEIQDLSKDLAWKEALAAKLAQSNTMEASIKHGSEEDILELKGQINSLLHEKEELEQQLKNQRNSNIDHKLAEQRRKRVKELEEKITTLNKKVIDQDRIIKMKEKSEEKIKTLNNEIMNMKQMKVRLINQMKSDGEKYRNWRSSREQEMCKLRQQNRLKETKFVKMETYYQKQQNVYKRKLEESASVIRRLKDTLALQKNAREKKSFLGNTEKVNHWVSQEFSAMVNTLEAERTLENLIEDRSLLAKEQSKLKVQATGLRTEQSHESIKAPNLQKDEKNKIEAQIKSLDEDLELRSTQIVDLKQKLQSLDSYQENKSKSRWDCIQTMADAKIALKYVFETANTYLSELHKDKSSKESALHELQESYNAVVSQLTEKEELLRQETLKLKKAENEYTDKVFMLLNKLKETGSDGSLLPLQDLSNANNVSEEDAKAVIQQQQMRIEELERQLEKRKVSKAKASKSDNWNAVLTPQTKKKFFEESDEEEENLDDSTNDPDWRKTPIYRRLRTIRAESRSMPVKRNIDGQPSCGCQSDCSTRLCSCRKMEKSCSGNCRCEDQNCKNKDTTSPNVSNNSSTDNSLIQKENDDMNITFKKPRLADLKSNRP